MSFGEVVRKLREDQDLTQETAAIEAGITPGNLSRIECGKSNPRWSTVERIADALDITLAELGAELDAHR